MYVESVPIEFLLREGLPLNEAEHICRLVPAFNRHCDYGIPILNPAGVSFQRPLFSTRRELLQMLQDGKALVLDRRCSHERAEILR